MTRGEWLRNREIWSLGRTEAGLLNEFDIPVVDLAVGHRPTLVIPTGAPEERSGGICSLRGVAAFNFVHPGRHFPEK
jgi:hypothetical protein